MQIPIKILSPSIAVLITPKGVRSGSLKLISKPSVIILLKRRSLGLSLHVTCRDWHIVDLPNIKHGNQRINMSE